MRSHSDCSSQRLDGVGRGQSTASVLVELAVSVAIGWVFVHRQFTLPAPMLPVDLFRRPVFALSVATAICAHAAQLIAFVALPFYFQDVGGLSPIQDRHADHPMAGRFSRHGTDRRPAGGRLFGRAAWRLGAGGDDAWTAAACCPAGRSRHDWMWRGGWRVWRRVRLLPVAQQPADDRQRAADRAGAGSGMLSTSRLLGQTTGSALVALVFGVTHGAGDAIELGTRLAIGMAAAFAAVAMVLSSLRVRQPQLL